MSKNTNRPKVGILSPYLNILGGGERYILTFASTLNKKYEVFLYADKDIVEKSLQRFNLPLTEINFKSENSIYKSNLLKRYINLRQYELFFYMTDGSLFFSGAKKNFLIIQSPLHIPHLSILNRFKLSNWQIICYSRFMKTIIQQRLGNNMKIYALPPGINIPSNTIDSRKKENVILSVGRFFPYPHDKKHDVLIDTFRTFYAKYFSGWKLIIAGGLTEEGGREMLNKLQHQAQGLPIEIYTDLSAHDLNKFYGHAKIYWHAAGFGEDLMKYPEKAEHFGIAPLEAMANGVVPLVYNGGGLKDIISEGQGGYLWNTSEELVKKTCNLINDEKLLDQQRITAILKAKDYSSDKFYEKLEKIISG